MNEGCNTWLMLGRWRQLVVLIGRLFLEACHLQLHRTGGFRMPVTAQDRGVQDACDCTGEGGTGIHNLQIQGTCNCAQHWVITAVPHWAHEHTSTGRPFGIGGGLLYPPETHPDRSEPEPSPLRGALCPPASQGDFSSSRTEGSKIPQGSSELCSHLCLC